jgi:hypothetical protein
MITQISYNVIIERFKAFASGHYLIERFTHGELDVTDIEKDNGYPWMHVFPVSIEPRGGSRLYSFAVIFADLPRDKETPTEYQRESLSDCIRLAEDLLAEIQNGLVVFGPTVELDGSPSIEPLIQEFTHTLTGVKLELTLSVPWDWSACDIPADWSVGGTGSGGSGVGIGLVLRVNGVDNISQDILNLIDGTNTTITDLGNGQVRIDATGGIQTINWGDIGGTLTNQTDLATALGLKANTADLGAVAFSNNYTDLDNLPTIPSVLNDLNDVDTAGQSLQKVLYYDGTKWIPYLLASVAYSGKYDDLSNKPVIPKTIEDLIGHGSAVGDIIEWNGSQWIVTALSFSLEKLSDVNVSPNPGDVLYWDDTAGEWINYQLAAVAYSGDYLDLGNKPTIPAAQIQSDWTQANNAALDYIKNKPTIPAAQIQSDWTQANTSALDYIKNKPSVGTGSVISVGTTGLISGGPITISGTITTAMDTNKLVGRYTAGTGIMEQITIGSGLTLTGAGVLNNTATPTPTGYYGAFQDTTSQTAASINTAYAVKFNTTDLSNGVTVVNDGSSNPTRVTLANTGIYNIQFSLQLEKTGGSGNMIADIWIRKNGVDVPSTTGKIVLTGSANASPVVAAWNYVLDLVAGDYVQLMWATTNTNVEIVAASATAPHPSIPSSILTVTQQAGILAGTGITAINSLTGAVQTMGVGTSGTDFAISSAGTAHTFNLPTASASNRGALSSADWSTFNSKVGTARSISTTSPLSGGGDLSANRTLSIADAAADGSTKGAAAFTAADFNATSGVISIDYTNAQKATSGQAGFLTAADWSTFNGKQNSIGLTTVGTALATLADPSVISYLRINANNTVTALTLAQLKSDLGIANQISYVTLTSDVNITASNTTLADITGLSFAITSGNSYRFRAELQVQTSASATGCKFAVNANVGVGSIVYRTTNVSGLQTGITTWGAFALDSATTTTGAVTTQQYVTIEGLIVANANGTVIMRFGKSVATAGTLAIKAGSVLQFQTL